VYENHLMYVLFDDVCNACSDVQARYLLSMKPLIATLRLI